MSTDPTTDAIYLDRQTFASIPHSISGRLPEGWSLLAPIGYGDKAKYIVALGCPDLGRDPLMAIRPLDESFETFRHAMTSEHNSGAHRIGTEELPFTEGNGRLLRTVFERRGYLYSVELNTSDIEAHRTTYDGFIDSINWDYAHTPRSLNEQFAALDARRKSLSRQEHNWLNAIWFAAVAAVVILFVARSCFGS